MLTHYQNEATLGGMKKQLSNLSLDVVLRTARQAGQKAAINAVAEGRVVTGWKDGCLVEYGPGALPLSPKLSEEEGVHVRTA